MDIRLDAFFQYLKTKQVTVVGIGVSNTPVVRLLAKKGVHVTVCDRKTPDKLGPVYEELHSYGTTMLVGEDYPERLPGDVIIRAPGVYFYSPQILQARARGAVVTSEMELFFDFCPCPIYGITGSEGKTTTTTIIANCLSRQGKMVHLGGNIGRCLFGDIEQVSPSDVAVVELSSFQLISMRRSPNVAVITNITPNHLDVHGTMEEYIAAKTNIFMHQSAFGRCVFNADNPVTAGFAAQARGTVSAFSLTAEQRDGAFLRDGSLWLSKDGQATEVMRAEEILLPGLHNVDNYLAAFAAVCDRVSTENMAAVARQFAGVAHRMEFIRELDGVKYYNDSIATTPTRVIAGLKTFGKNVILIGGGYDKKIPFEPMAEPVIECCKAVILSGATAEKMAAAITSHPDYDLQKLPVVFAAGMGEAVMKARMMARPGDIVTLSPACASFDRYPNFEVRGEEYRTIVEKL